MGKLVSISEAASIALHGTILIAKSKEPVNVIKIAEATGTSRHHVAKIMQRLVKENFLRSQRGPTGGFMLKKKARQITFLELYETIEGKIEVSDCLMEKQICPFGKCIMDNVTKKMTLEFKDFLQRQNLGIYI